MSKLPLDLAKFKRVGSAPHETTLQHPDGHKIIINHGALDQKKLSALNDLPLLSQEDKLPEKRKMMAEGGDPAASDQTPLEVEPIPQEEQQAQEAQAAPQEQAPQAAPQEAQPQVQEAQGPASTGTTEEIQGTPIQPAPTQEEQNQHAWTTDPGANLNIINQEQAALASDMAKGHITPKTYADLLGEKSGPGKVLSIFGLLLGGMGSGLTHTENPVTAMWDKQISNDLEAQKQNATNKQTLFSLNRQRFPDVESATNFTRMQTNIGYLHHLSEDLQDVKKYPIGSPARQQAEQALATIGQFINTENYTLSGQIAAKQALIKSMQAPTMSGEDQYQNRQKIMRLSGNPALSKMADINDERHIPGIPGSASMPIPQAARDEVQAMNVLDNKASDLLQFAQAHKGTLSPSQKATGAQKAEELLNFYNNSIKGGVLTEGRLKWLDSQVNKNPTSIFQDILGNNARLREIQNSNNQRRGILLKSLGFPQAQAPQPNPSPQAQPQYKISGGVKYMRGPNGEAIPVK